MKLSNLMPKTTTPTTTNKASNTEKAGKAFGVSVQNAEKNFSKADCPPCGGCY